MAKVKKRIMKKRRVNSKSSVLVRVDEEPIDINNLMGRLCSRCGDEILSRGIGNVCTLCELIISDINKSREVDSLRYRNNDPLEVFRNAYIVHLPQRYSIGDYLEEAI